MDTDKEGDCQQCNKTCQLYKGEEAKKALKEDWISSKCKEIDELQKAGRNYILYKVVKELAGINIKRQKGTQAILYKDGILLTENNDIRNKWKEYMEDLYMLQIKNQCPLEDEEIVNDENKGPVFLKDEIRKGTRNTPFTLCNKSIASPQRNEKYI